MSRRPSTDPRPVSPANGRGAQIRTARVDSVTRRTTAAVGGCWLRRPSLTQCVCGHPALTAGERATVLEDCDFDLCDTCAETRRRRDEDERRAADRVDEKREAAKERHRARRGKGKAHHGSSAKPYSQKRK